jgi:hypothetical protein
MLPPECNCESLISKIAPCPIHGTIGKEEYERLDNRAKDAVLQSKLNGVLDGCPCCRGKAREYAANDGLVVECTKCGLRMYRAFVPPSEWWKAAEECRRAWNKRAD